MSNKDQQPDKSGFSLQDEIKKRKTQEMQRSIVQKQVDVARGESPAKSDPRRASQTMSPAQPAADPRRSTQTSNVVPDPKRATQTSSVVAPAADPRRASQTAPAASPTSDPRRATQVARPAADPRRMTQAIPSANKHSQRTHLIAAGAGTLAIAVLIGTFLIASNYNNNTVPTVQPTATLQALPTVSANNVVDYLKNAGVPISGLRVLPVDPAVWSADEEIQFDVQRSGNKGTYIVLSYTSHNGAVGDSFRAERNPNIKDWQVSNISNVLLLTAPDAAPDITSEMASHLTSYLLAPYRPFLATATPAPATEAATEQATP